MLVFKQSPTLKQAFDQTVHTKVADRREEQKESLGGGLLGTIGASLFAFQDFKKSIKGNVGETFVNLFLHSLSDSWMSCHNAYIPGYRPGTLTEIDNLMIGPGGVYLVEVKTWKGSFSAYRDKWKRRQGKQWIAMTNSPTSQSFYHQQRFEQWIRKAVPNLPRNFEDCIEAPVVFPKVQWLGINQCSVPVYQNIPELIQAILAAPNRLNRDQVEAIAQAVRDYRLD